MRYPWLKYVWVVGVSILIVVIGSRFFFFERSRLEEYGSMAGYPCMVAGQSFISTLRSFFRQEQSSSDLLQLREENAQLLQENATLKTFFYKSNLDADLREFSQRYNLEGAITAQVISRHTSPEEHAILVNKGSHDGIQMNMAVLYKFQIIGRVISVFPWYSKVMLITDRRSFIGGFTNMGNVQGVAQGAHEPNAILLTYVNKQIPVQDEDLVLSTGQGLIYPEGFCVGKIVRHEAEEVYHRIEIRPMVDLQTISSCMLIEREKVNSKHIFQ